MPSETKGPLTRQTRRAQRMKEGPAHTGAARDRTRRLRRIAHRARPLSDRASPALRVRDQSRRLPQQERPHRQTQNHKKDRHFDTPR